MQFAVLGSGSKGNCSLVRSEQSLLMIDCGFSVKETEARLTTLALKPADIDAILVTHEHSDHITGVAKFAKKHQTPVYLTHGTQQYFTAKGIDLAQLSLHRIDLDTPFSLGDVRITPVPVPHDAKEPCQFIFNTDETCLGVLSDIGHISEHVAAAYRHCRSLYIEFNHCKDMLRTGPYPAMLKRRVGGQWGHLSNHQAAAFLQSLRGGPLHTVIVGHISEKNNSEAVVQAALDELDFLKQVTLSSQHSPQPWVNAI